jgi:hypothetical protein
MIIGRKLCTFHFFLRKEYLRFLLFSLFVSKAYGGAGGAALLINNPPSVCISSSFFSCFSLKVWWHAATLFLFTLLAYILWRSSLNIHLCVVVFYCGASKTRNLSLKVEEIHQSF